MTKPTNFYVYLIKLTYRIGKRTGSDLLIANAWHHRSDSLSAGIAVLGTAAAIMGIQWADPVAAVVVGLLIGSIGVKTCYKSLQVCNFQPFHFSNFFFLD